MSPRLPEQLWYLATAVDALEAFSPESLEDDNSEDDEPLDIVEAPLRSRVQFVDEDDAYDVIDQDRKALGEWLEQQQSPSAPATFIHGMMGAWLMFGNIGELTR